MLLLLLTACLPSPPSWPLPPPVLLQETAGGRLGSALSAAGDLNGDGVADLAVGAPIAADGESYEGLVYIYLGAAGALPEVPDQVLQLDRTNAAFGTAVVSAGDVDGDGFSDLLVGASSWAETLPGQGAVALFRGQPGGVDPTPASFLLFGEREAHVGNTLAGLGDVDSDGYSDVAIAASRWDGPAVDSGAVFIHHGGPAGLELSPRTTITGVDPNEHLGTAITGVHDFNGDGHADLAIASADVSTWTSSGRVDLHLGGPAGMGTRTARQDSTRSGERLGASIAGPGDLDDDGLADLAAGSPNASLPQRGEGLAQVWTGRTAAPWFGSPQVLQGDQNDATLGSGLGALGDVDGDRRADLGVGAGRWRERVADEGALLVYRGDEDGVADAASLILAGGEAESGAGYAVGTPGDLDQDGFADLAVGLPNLDGADVDDGGVRLVRGMANGPADPVALPAPAGVLAFGASGIDASTDIDGDGWSDLIISAPFDGDGEAEEGLVFVYRGGRDGPAPWLVLQADRPDAHLGSAVAGDINGDGLPDILVGAWGWSDGEAEEGALLVFLGSAQGPSIRPDMVYTSDIAEAWLGSDVAVGDIDGDGYDDVAIGASAATHGDVYEGQVHLLRGSRAGLQPWQVIDSDIPNENLGYGVALADVDGNGLADLIAGAPGHRAGIIGEGAVFLYLAQSGGPSATPHQLLPGSVSVASVGDCVASADVNGDGFADVVAGAPGYHDGQGGEGAVLLWLGGPTGLDPVPQILPSNLPDTRLGESVATPGDVDGDGFADVVAGATWYSVEADYAGSAWLMRGGPGGLSPAEVISGSSESGYAGGTVGGGDLNGDGFGDLLFDSYDDAGTTIAMVLGNDASPGRDTPRARAVLPGSDRAIPHGLRTGADDRFDVLVSRYRPNIGRADMRLAVEVKPDGAPFDGQGLQVGPWVDSTGFGTSLRLTVTGLTREQGYHWRARVETHPRHAAPHATSTWMWGGRPGHPHARHLVAGRYLGAPVAQPDGAELDEGGVVSVDLLANDADPDEVLDGSRVTLVDLPAHGQAALQAGVVSYTHDGGESDRDGFSYRVCDADGLCDVALVSLTIRPVNDAPSLMLQPDLTMGALEATSVPVQATDPDDPAEALEIRVDTRSADLLPPRNLVHVGEVLTLVGEGRSGLAEVTAQVFDPAGAAATAILQVTLTCPSDLDADTWCDPTDPDDDDDGLSDESEATFGSDPSRADADRDGLEDPVERELGTEPELADSDGDGLDDGAELTAGTDPLLQDSDGDGMVDGVEQTQGLNPRDADSDGDGLLDGEESTTDPALADTDGDGLADGAEVEIGSDPLAADADSDGLTDGEEVGRGTDPRAADSDSDGVEDGDEVAAGTDPLQPEVAGCGCRQGGSGWSPLLWVWMLGWRRRRRDASRAPVGA